MKHRVPKSSSRSHRSATELKVDSRSVARRGVEVHTVGVRNGTARANVNARGKDGSPLVLAADAGALRSHLFLDAAQTLTPRTTTLTP